MKKGSLENFNKINDSYFKIINDNMTQLFKKVH